MKWWNFEKTLCGPLHEDNGFGIGLACALWCCFHMKLKEESCAIALMQFFYSVKRSLRVQVLLHIAFFAQTILVQ